MYIESKCKFEWTSSAIKYFQRQILSYCYYLCYIERLESQKSCEAKWLCNNVVCRKRGNFSLKSHNTTVYHIEICPRLQTATLCNYPPQVFSWHWRNGGYSKERIHLVRCWNNMFYLAIIELFVYVYHLDQLSLTRATLTWHGDHIVEADQSMRTAWCRWRCFALQSSQFSGLRWLACGKRSLIGRWES